MMMGLFFVEMLLQRRQYADAEKALRQHLSQHADDGAAHAMLAVALSMQDRFDDALMEARWSIRCDPNDAYNHQALALSYLGLRKYDEARLAIQEAIRLAPQNAQFHSLLARIRLNEGRWDEALRAVETALQLEPENVELANLRAEALVKLGRKQEASAILQGALAKDPNNPNSHAAQGWTMLHRGEINQAIEHYREALRLNPNNQWAQAGIIEALKARNPIYRVMLAYFLRIDKLDMRARIGLAVGGWFAIQVLRRIGDSNPSIAPIAYGIVGLYLGFLFLTWTAPILFDLMLRVHRFGRLALPKERKMASNWVGLCLLIAGGFLVAAIPAAEGDRLPLLGGAAKSAALILPIGGSFQATGEGRRSLLFYTVGLAVVGVLGLYSALNSGEFSGWDFLFILGIVAFSWIASYVIAQED
jgi:tetratricopeptide (TPR) repeat protein